MPTKEFREFFLRNSAVSSGAKRDQEVGFPVSYLVRGMSKFNRFLKANFPSENVFVKLFESITFKLNVEDTASTTIQGLVKKTSDADAIAKTIFTDGYTRTLEPHQIPDVEIDGTSSGSTLTVTAGTNSLGGGKSRKKYTLKIVTPVYTDKVVILSSDSTETNNASTGGAGIQTMKTYAMPANTLSAITDYLIVETSYQVVTTGFYTIALFFGSTGVIAGTVANANDMISIKAKIHRRSASSQMSDCSGWTGNLGVTAKTCLGQITTSSEDLTAIVNIASKLSVFGVTTASVVKCHSLTVTHYKQ